MHELGERSKAGEEMVLLPGLPEIMLEGSKLQFSAPNTCTPAGCSQAALVSKRNGYCSSTDMTLERLKTTRPTMPSNSTMPGRFTNHSARRLQGSGRGRLLLA